MTAHSPIAGSVGEDGLDDEAEIWCRLMGRALDALDAIANWEFGPGLGEDAGGIIGFAEESAKLIRADYPILAKPPRISSAIDEEECGNFSASDTGSSQACCSDCPPVGYPTDKTRCAPCPRISPNRRG